MNEKFIVVAPVGDFMDALYVGLKEYSAERVILISSKTLISQANKAKTDLDKFKIPVKIIEINGHVFEETFKAISEIAKTEKDKEIMINVSTGDKDTQCAATCGAFVNGLKAFAVSGETIMSLPVLHFSYYNLLTEKKMDILKIMHENNDTLSFDDLSKKTKMSLPLISYHVNGNLKSQGLVEMNLVESKEIKGKVNLTLTSLGKLLVKGYIKK